MDKSISTKCGHVTRRLKNNEPLTGKVLEFALSVIGEPKDELLSGMARKLKIGEELSEYEAHIMVDVLLLHVRLGCSS